MLSERCPVCRVCNVGVLWPNGWMDQDETWHGPIGLGTGHIAAVLQRGTVPQFSVNVCCGQTAGWIKMPLGTDVDIDPRPLRPMFIVAHLTY